MRSDDDEQGPRDLLGRGRLVALYTVTVAFITGYALDDPGGWRAVSMVAMWLVLRALLTAAAASRSAWRAWRTA